MLDMQNMGFGDRVDGAAVADKKLRYSQDDNGEHADSAELQPKGSLTHSLDSFGNDTVDITNIDPRAVDAMLANELQQLSFQDREAVNEVSEEQLNKTAVVESFTRPF